ncbi:MAG: glycosyltransferase family 4 protein [Porphyromonadaceae bacterium]|nr:glycosyltransferase family 4 protein [Porphyromonadaceae bacterium]
MRIVYNILNTWYSGGLTRVLANKANYLVEHGYEVFVVTTDQMGQGHFYTMSDKITFIDLGINYHIHDQEGLLGKLRHVPMKVYRHKRLLGRILRKLKADIVISLFGKEAFFLPSIKDGSRKVLEAHGSRYTWVHSRHGLVGNIQSWLDLKLVHRFDKFVVLTHEDKPDWGNLPNITVITNANSFESEELSPLTSKVVLAAGRYGYQKNFESLLEAWAIVHKAYPDWELRLRGEGLEQLDGELDRLGITSSVSRANSKNMLPEYLDSSIFVLSSRHEGLGLVLLEAQVCGVPLVSYACKCGPSEIIVEGENGFLVPVGDHEALAERLMRLIASPELRGHMGQNAKRHSQRFAEEAIMAQWHKLFVSLTKR